ncbi:MAG: hypothetical protein JWO36_864, partial [Myxococcales bacterium]|nr:hypothetical protein [Myxococcales bacterium]
MKKCASCTKDLPEAALHCVFCGAKQAPAPAVQPGVAKTAFGYSANDVLDAVKQQQQRPGPSQQPMAAPRANNPSQPNYPAAPRPTGGSQPPGYGAQTPQQAAANAATMFVPGGGQPPQPSPPAPMQQPHLQPTQVPPPPSGGMGGGMSGGGMSGGGMSGGMMSPSGRSARPSGGLIGMNGPIDMGGASPYLASQTASRAGHPSEPWAHSLKAMMFIWGALTLIAFATPLSTDPLAFNWDAILHGEGKAKLPMLIIASVGLLSVVIAAIPMPAMPRGILAALFGLVGVFVPLAITKFPEWQQLLPIVGVLVLVPGLLVRNEYREALLPRVLVTIGVLSLLVPYLIPVHGDIPLVSLFKGLIEAPGKLKVVALLQLVFIVVIVLSLLAWMPAPATGGAKVFAWLLILFQVVAH